MGLLLLDVSFRNHFRPACAFATAEFAAPRKSGKEQGPYGL
jgi:hypothetical protein